MNVTLSTVDDESSVSSYTTDYKDIDKDIDSDHEITEYGTTRKMRERDSIEKNGWLQLQQNDIEQYMNNRKDFTARDNLAIPLLNNRNPRTPLPSCKTDMIFFWRPSYITAIVQIFTKSSINLPTGNLRQKFKCVQGACLKRVQYMASLTAVNFIC